MFRGRDLERDSSSDVDEPRSSGVCQCQEWVFGTPGKGSGLEGAAVFFRAGHRSQRPFQAGAPRPGARARIRPDLVRFGCNSSSDITKVAVVFFAAAFVSFAMGAEPGIDVHRRPAGPHPPANPTRSSLLLRSATETSALAAKTIAGGSVNGIRNRSTT